jgi:hypothetical protein
VIAKAAATTEALVGCSADEEVSGADEDDLEDAEALDIRQCD